MKVSELSGAALDWAAGKALQPAMKHPERFGIGSFGPLFSTGYLYPCWGGQKFNPSSNWEQGGPIIEREHISPHWVLSGPQIPGCWSAHIPGGNGRMLYGPTPLIAAMRCYVASKLGDEIEIPKELT